MSVMTIGDFAKATGVPAPKLRRLQASGNLIPAVVTNGGHRRYDSSQLDDALQYVRRMKLLPDGENVIDDSESMDDFFAYLLGLILADGTVLKSSQVQLEMKDKQIVDDVAKILGVVVYKRPDRDMYRITVPRPIAWRLIEFGACRRKSKGFIVPRMNERAFGCFLRGLFDGDGSLSIREGRITLRFHGHPKAMAYIQATLLGHYEMYLPWVLDNRLESGMLETSRKSTVGAIRDIMYATEGVSLGRKREGFNKGGCYYGNGIDVVPSHPV